MDLYRPFAQQLEKKSKKSRPDMNDEARGEDLGVNTNARYVEDRRCDTTSMKLSNGSRKSSVKPSGKCSN